MFLKLLFFLLLLADLGKLRRRKRSGSFGTLSSFFGNYRNASLVLLLSPCLKHGRKQAAVMRLLQRRGDEEEEEAWEAGVLCHPLIASFIWPEEVGAEGWRVQ